MNDEQPDLGLSDDELNAQGATALPDKEVVSILDLNADLDLAIDAAAPIDLAVAANANVAAPIDAAVGANMLSIGSTAQALTDQGVIIDQGIDADATATADAGQRHRPGQRRVDDGTRHRRRPTGGAAAAAPWAPPRDRRPRRTRSAALPATRSARHGPAALTVG